MTKQELKQHLIEEILPKEKAKCICHAGGGYSICCDECKNSFFCGYGFALSEVHASLDKVIEYIYEDLIRKIKESRTLEERYGVGIREETARMQLIADIYPF